MMSINVSILTIASGEEFYERNKTGIETTQEYADRHGYHYTVLRELDQYKKHPYCTKQPSSYKLIAMINEMVSERKPKWVFWIDADTMIMDQTKRLEDWLNVSSDVNYIFSKDVFPGEKTVNCGVWFARNTPAVQQQLLEWFAGPEHKIYWEQNYINETLDHSQAVIAHNLSGIFRLHAHHPRSAWYQAQKHWILHAAGCRGGRRSSKPILDGFRHLIKKV